MNLEVSSNLNDSIIQILSDTGWVFVSSGSYLPSRVCTALQNKMISIWGSLGKLQEKKKTLIPGNNQ